jgi:hypothetical protein
MWNKLRLLVKTQPKVDKMEIILNEPIIDLHEWDARLEKEEKEMAKRQIKVH